MVSKTSHSPEALVSAKKKSSSQAKAPTAAAQGKKAATNSNSKSNKRPRAKPGVKADQERKRRREEHEALKASVENFELLRTFSNLKRRAEDLFGEASTLQRRLHVPLPDEAAIPAEELETLERLHEKRLADMCGTICKKILAGIMAHKWSFPFNRPVDMKMYPDYSKKVDRAMDFGTIKANVEKNVYTHPEAFVEDVRLVFRNARSYNDPGSDVHAMARTLQEKFEDRYAASIVPRLVEAQKQRDADKIELRRRMAEQKALGGRERADGECAAIIQAIDSLLADVDIEKIKAATACGPVPRKEKEALVEKFREMDESVLGKALGIVFHHFPGVKGPSEVAFDVETLDSLCLRQVMSYVEGTEHDVKKIWPPKAYIAKGL